jgi:hypothetical protein
VFENDGNELVRAMADGGDIVTAFHCYTSGRKDTRRAEKVHKLTVSLLAKRIGRRKSRDKATFDGCAPGRSGGRGGEEAGEQAVASPVP